MAGLAADGGDVRDGREGRAFGDVPFYAVFVALCVISNENGWRSDCAELLDTKSFGHLDSVCAKGECERCPVMDNA